METKRKKQLKGGTLRRVMADEIKRVMAKIGSTNEGTQRTIDLAALELGITPRTLRDWLGPVEKKGWEELQVSPREAMDKLLNTPAAKPRKKTGAKKKGKICAPTKRRALTA